LLLGASADALPTADGTPFRFGAMVAAVNLHIHTKLNLGMSRVRVLVAPGLCP
jgi:hypothetical protein